MLASFLPAQTGERTFAVLHETSKIKIIFPRASDHWIVNNFDIIHNLPNQSNELGNTFYFT